LNIFSWLRSQRPPRASRRKAGEADAKPGGRPHQPAAAEQLQFRRRIAVAVFVILDIEYPRAGLIRVDTFDQVLVELRQSMR
jgi:hypothetical protein